MVILTRRTHNGYCGEPYQETRRDKHEPWSRPWWLGLLNTNCCVNLTLCFSVCASAFGHTPTLSAQRPRGNGEEQKAVMVSSRRQTNIKKQEITHPNWMLISAEIWNASRKVPLGFVLSPGSFSISCRLREMHFVLHWYAFCLLGSGPGRRESV